MLHIHTEVQTRATNMCLFRTTLSSSYFSPSFFFTDSYLGITHLGLFSLYIPSTPVTFANNFITVNNLKIHKTKIKKWWTWWAINTQNGFFKKIIPYQVSAKEFSLPICVGLKKLPLPKDLYILCTL